jgi:predicted TIM-barrel fold metal-dependent hydrolase
VTKKTNEKLLFNDGNVMIGPWTYPLRFTTCGQLVKEMDYFNIRHALVYHAASWHHHPQTGNSMLMAELAGHEDRLLPCWTVVPTAAREQGKAGDIVHELKKHHVRAVRVFPKSQKFLFNEWILGDLCAALEEKQVPILVHKSELDDNAADLYPICRAFQKLPVILTTSSYFHTRILFTILEKCPNFVIDTATFLMHGGIEDVVKRFGGERLIFGSQMPFVEPGAAMAAVLFAEIADKDKRKIAHENFNRLFKVTPKK